MPTRPELQPSLHLAQRMLPLALVVWAMVGVATPVAAAWQQLAELQDAGDRLAERIAALAARETTSQPDLWRYDTAKLGEQIAALSADQGAVGVLVEHDGATAVAVPDGSAQAVHAPQVLWRSVAAHGPVGVRIHVAIDLAPLWRRSAWLLLMFCLVGAGLAALLWWLPLRAVRGAEQDIRALVVELQHSRQELQALAGNLEGRVQQRSQELELALADLRDLGIRATRLQEDERRQIGRDLHDGIGQTLTAIRLQLQALAAKLPDRQEHWAALLRLVDLGLDEARTASRRLSPALLAEVGLAAAVAQTCDAMAARGGLQVRADCPALPALGAEVEAACFRIVQEALTNVARHAGAQQATVTLSLDADALMVRVCDDGRGFDPGQRHSGQGLAGMRQRAALLGGTMAVRSAPGRGCEVTARLPIRAIDPASPAGSAA